MQTVFPILSHRGVRTQISTPIYCFFSSLHTHLQPGLNPLLLARNQRKPEGVVWFALPAFPTHFNLYLKLIQYSSEKNINLFHNLLPCAASAGSSAVPQLCDTVPGSGRDKPRVRQRHSSTLKHLSTQGHVTIRGDTHRSQGSQQEWRQDGPADPLQSQGCGRKGFALQGAGSSELGPQLLGLQEAVPMCDHPNGHHPEGPGMKGSNLCPELETGPFCGKQELYSLSENICLFLLII